MLRLSMLNVQLKSDEAKLLPFGYMTVGSDAEKNVSEAYNVQISELVYW